MSTRVIKRSMSTRPHDIKPLRGLPEPLPADEHLLWQGAPDWWALACSAFHAKKLITYFGIILVLRAATVVSSGGTVTAALMAALWLLPLASAAIAMLLLMAWLTSRTTVYSITDKRVILHVGVVLDLTFNLPFDAIEMVGLKWLGTGMGNMGSLTIALKAPAKIAYVHLWPHARPWRFAQPEPMLRAIPKAGEVGVLLAQALATHLGDNAHESEQQPKPLSMPGYASTPVQQQPLAA